MINNIPTELLVNILRHSTIVCLFVCNKWHDLSTDKKNMIVKTCANTSCNRIIMYGTTRAFSWKNYNSYYEELDKKHEILNPLANLNNSSNFFSFCLHPRQYVPCGHTYKCRCGSTEL
jgi:hypothetical protein